MSTLSYHFPEFAIGAVVSGPSRRGHCCAPPLADPSGRD